MKRLIDNDVSLLNRLMMKLAWGNHHAAKAQIYVAAECIRGAREQHCSSFRTLISSAMTVLEKIECLNLLKRMRLSYNASTERKNENKRAKSLREKMQEIKLDKFCYPILCYDNLGFRNRQGYKKGLGYEQFTILFLTIISRSQLTTIRIYGPTHLP